MDATVVAFTFGSPRSLAMFAACSRSEPAAREPQSILREEGRSGTAQPRRTVVRRALVTAQVAFAFMLLIGAGLLLASFTRARGAARVRCRRSLTGNVARPPLATRRISERVAFTARRSNECVLPACRPPA